VTREGFTIALQAKLVVYSPLNEVEGNLRQSPFRQQAQIIEIHGLLNVHAICLA
jgi:hypothetical protein